MVLRTNALNISNVWYIQWCMGTMGYIYNKMFNAYKWIDVVNNKIVKQLLWMCNFRWGCIKCNGDVICRRIHLVRVACLYEFNVLCGVQRVQRYPSVWIIKLKFLIYSKCVNVNFPFVFSVRMDSWVIFEYKFDF